MSEFANPAQFTAREISAHYESDTLTPTQLLAALRARIEEREADVGAWQFLDWQIVEQQLSAISEIEPGKRGALWGIPVAIKDLFDTYDMPTGYGSEIYAVHHPAADAACIARLRAAGAIILGKTVSTEFAYWKAGKTRNPLNLEHSPGGSSSGSVAAVADCMVPLAIGSQTAASTIRPASYCGIVGFKPSFNQISLAGVKALAGGLDTVGMFARSVADVARLFGTLAGSAPSSIGAAARNQPPIVRVWSGREQAAAGDESRAAVKACLEKLGLAAAREMELPKGFTELLDAQTRVMAFEATRELAHEARAHLDQLSQPLRELFDAGQDVSIEEHARAYELRDTCLSRLDELFGDADTLVLPSATGTAPLLSEGTGDPVMSRAWTFLGLPSLTLKCGAAENGLPLGIQLAARPGQDAHLLATACWFESKMASVE